MLTPSGLHEKLQMIDDENQRSAFIKEHMIELAEMVRRVNDPSSFDFIDAREVERKREIEWCSQNPDPGIEVGTLLWGTRRGERVPITVTAVQRFPEGLRRYTVLKDGVSEDWSEQLLMYRTRPT